MLSNANCHFKSISSMSSSGFYSSYCSFSCSRILLSFKLDKSGSKSENLDVTTVVTPSNEKTVKNKGVFNTVESNTVRRECCAPINKELVSDGKKKTVVPTIPKVDVVRPKQQEKPVRKTVKQVNTARQKAVVNVVKMNRVNAVKASACWVWRPVKPNSASITLKKYDYGNPKTKLEDLVRLNNPKDEKRAGAELTQQNDKSQYKK
ncbi:hypothetical protein Tco_0729428 [Tanacetum coccineum]|uniref:Uncharacterized protein n=1 Tax=Tanacetum coccineum TaxID=301880 RepID=A0ABQ4YPS3_9ASTR